MTVFLVEFLDRRRIVHQGDHDGAVFRGLGALHDHDVAVENARFDHAGAADAQGKEIGLAAVSLAHGIADIAVQIFHSEDRLSGGDTAHDRHAHGRHFGIDRVVVVDAQCAAFSVFLVDIALALQPFEIGVYRRGALDVECGADVADGRRISVLAEGGFDEIENHLLLRCECVHRIYPIFSGFCFRGPAGRVWDPPHRHVPPDLAVYSIPHFLPVVNTCSKDFLTFFVDWQDFFRRRLLFAAKKPYRTAVSLRRDGRNSYAKSAIPVCRSAQRLGLARFHSRRVGSFHHIFRKMCPRASKNSKIFP